MRVWSREVPVAWQEALERISGQPRSDRVPWLALVWEPGEAWEPVERWLIYEMIPQARLLADPRHLVQAQGVLDALRGPPPITLRTWRVVNGKRTCQSESPVTQREWELYHRTGCYGRPYWVIQGSEGGHKRWFNPVEQRVLRLGGRPWADPPAPGDLPYAEWDGRVEAALGRERDLLDIQTEMRNIERRTARYWRREMRKRERTLAQRLLIHLDQQLKAAVESARYQWNPSDLPAGAPITDEDMEQAEQEFLAEATVHTGDE